MASGFVRCNDYFWLVEETILFQIYLLQSNDELEQCCGKEVICI